MSSWLTWFTSPWGLVLLAALDSSPFVFLPFANDAVVVYLAARAADRFWLYPLLATAGAVAGSVVSYYAGAWVGDEGLDRFVSRRKLDRLRARAQGTSAVALALPALFPPPFPFTPFVLAAGAFRVSRLPFFLAVAAARLVRYFTEAVLAQRYGSAIVGWMESGPFRTVVWAFVVVFFLGTGYSIYRVAKGARAPART